jgi:predicted PurR-regulated permease PerM
MKNPIKVSGISVAIAIIIMTGIYAAQSILNPLLMALFITIILMQPLRWLRRKVSSGWAIFLVILGFLGFYMGFIGLLNKSVMLFIDNASVYEENLAGMVARSNEILEQYGVNLLVLGESSMNPSKIMSYASSLMGGLGDLMSNEFTFLLFTIFLISEIPESAIKLDYLVQGDQQVKDFLNEIGIKIRHYLSIKTVTSLATGILIAIALAILGLDFPILWGFLAFMLNYIPNIGSILAALPAMALALVQLGFQGALFTGIIYLVVNMLIGNVVEPKMMGKGLGLSTFIVFLSLIFWAFLLGTVGMFLSIPITMVIKIILEQNPATKWIAIILGTEDDVKAVKIK